MSLSRSFWVLLASFALPLPFLLMASLAPDPQWLKRVWDVGHIPLFAFWMLLAVRLLPLPNSVVFIALRVLGLLGIAIAIEFIQKRTGRQFSMTDVYLDACGIAVGARFSLPAISKSPTWFLRAGDAVLIICIGIGLQDAGSAVFHRVYARLQIPQLWSASQFLANSRLAGSSKHEIIADGESGQPLLQVTFGTGRYSTLELMAMAGDWRNYANLNITVRNPSQTPLEITCRVHDRLHYANGAKFDDRFNRRVTLATGWNTVSFNLHDIETAPKKRSMEMDRVENLTCFTVRLASPRQAYFKEIWLGQ